MKIIFGLLCLISFCFFTPGKEKEVNKITIGYIPWMTESIVKIKCSEFDNRNDISKVTIKDKRIGKRLMKSIDNMHYLHLNKDWEPDVRVKVNILYNDSTESELCIGGYEAMMLDGKPCRNVNLGKYIRRVIHYYDKSYSTSDQLGK